MYRSIEFEFCVFVFFQLPSHLHFFFPARTEIGHRWNVGDSLSESGLCLTPLTIPTESRRGQSVHEI